MKRIVCRNCRATIPPKPEGKGRRAKYCNKYCAIQYRAARQLRAPTYKKPVSQCPICLQPFNPVNSRHVICSEACRVTASRAAFQRADKRPNVLQTEINKVFLTDQIIQRAADKRATLPPKPIRRRGPNPETAKRKAKHVALKAKWNQARAAVQQTRAARKTALVSPSIDHLRTFEP